MNDQEYSEFAKEYLKSKKGLKQYVDELFEELKELKKKEFYTGVYATNDKVQESIKNFDDKYTKYIVMKEKYKKTIDKELEKLMELDAYIEKIQNIDMKKVIRFRYINNESWKVVANYMNISTGTVHRIHRKALVELGKILKNNS